MAVLVTGAAGFIGSHLVERLLANGRAVVGIDSFDRFYDPAIKRANLSRAQVHGAFRLLAGDIRDSGTWEAVGEPIDTVVHLAARAGVRPSIEDPELYADVNLLGTSRVLAFCTRRGVGRLVFGSSSSVYGERHSGAFAETDAAENPISPYAATKRGGELLCHAWHHLTGGAAVCLRFFTAYGPRQRPDLAIHKFARLMAAGRAVPMFGDGSSERDYTYVDDVVEGIVRAMGLSERTPSSYHIVNVGGGSAVTLSRMIRTLGDALGIEPTIDARPPQPGDVSRTLADPSRARELLGFVPAVQFDDGIARFVRWFRAQDAEPGR